MAITHMPHTHEHMHTHTHTHTHTSGVDRRVVLMVGHAREWGGGGGADPPEHF